MNISDLYYYQTLNKYLTWFEKKGIDEEIFFDDVLHFCEKRVCNSHIYKNRYRSKFLISEFESYEVDTNHLDKILMLIGNDRLDGSFNKDILSFESHLGREFIFFYEKERLLLRGILSKYNQKSDPFIEDLLTFEVSNKIYYEASPLHILVMIEKKEE